jgi:hypothetical protein
MLTARLAEAYRVLKPGGHALVWSIPRTSHWTAWAIEDAGFDVRDCILHLFGSGFPKSLDVSKAIDKRGGNAHLAAEVGAAIKAAREARGWTTGRADKHFCGGSTNWTWYEGRKGVCRPPMAADFARIVAEWPELAPLAGKVAEVEREIVSQNPNHRDVSHRDNSYPMGKAIGGEYITDAATEDAARWEGWGTALKPGQEMWWLARKPLKGTVAAGVLEFGTGALNIAACKVEATGRPLRESRQAGPTVSTYGDGLNGSRAIGTTDAGRWPANVVFTHSAACDGRCAPDCPAGELDRQSGVLTSSLRARNYDTPATNEVYSDLVRSRANPGNTYGDAGGASRFYPVFRYQAKAPASERPRLEDGTAHETVKPLGLMAWLVRLITPPGGTVLDLFAGSGPVAEACIIEGFRCVLIEQDPKSAELIRKRLGKPIQPVMFGLDDGVVA